MNEIMLHILVVLAGGVLGVLFFGGLWWTVKKGVSSTQPALLFFVSMLLRTIVVLIGFYFIGGGHWSRLLSCLLGFIIARLIVMRYTDLLAEIPLATQSPAKEADHASES